MDDHTTEWEPIEPTTPVANPYEYEYEYGYVGIPPPPPKGASKMVWIAIISIFSVLLLFCSAVLFYWASVYHTGTMKPTPVATSLRVVPTSTPTPAQTSTSVIIVETATPGPTPTSAPMPTPTSLPVITTAQDLYTQFTDAGISMGGAGTIDNSWWLQCCSYYPANGSLTFVDIASGGSMAIALFAHATAAQQDVTQLDAVSNHPGSYQKGTCLLLYWSAYTNLTPYEQVMQQYCA